MTPRLARGWSTSATTFFDLEGEARGRAPSQVSCKYLHVIGAQLQLTAIRRTMAREGERVCEHVDLWTSARRPLPGPRTPQCAGLDRGAPRRVRSARAPPATFCFSRSKRTKKTADQRALGSPLAIHVDRKLTRLDVCTRKLRSHSLELLRASQRHARSRWPPFDRELRSIDIDDGVFRV